MALATKPLSQKTLYEQWAGRKSSRRANLRGFLHDKEVYLRKMIRPQWGLYCLLQYNTAIDSGEIVVCLTTPEGNKCDDIKDEFDDFPSDGLIAQTLMVAGK